MSAPIPVDEIPRLRSLRALFVLDTAAEPLFDALAQAAASITGASVALISLIDAERQWIKANIGLAGRHEIPRGQSFCAHAILGSDVLEIPDAQCDPRFADNPLVTGDPHIRFYAGMPITLSDGFRVGSLCVIDRASRSLSETQRSALKALAHAAAEAFEFRARTAESPAASAAVGAALSARLATGQLERGLKETTVLLDRTEQLVGVGGWAVDLGSNEVFWSAGTCRIHDVPPGYRPTLDEAIDFYTPQARPVIRSAIEKAIAEGAGWDLQLPIITAIGRELWLRAVGLVEYADDGQPRRLVGAIQDITLRRRAIVALEASDRRFRKLFEYSLGLICTHDHDGVLLSVNPAAARSLGYSVGELLGRPLTDIIRPGRQAAFHDYLLRIMTHDHDAGVLDLVAKDGSMHTWQYQNVLDDDVDEPYVLCHALDITERRLHELKLEELSVRDPLTGCFNRRFLAQLRLPKSGPWGCIALDLDHFKQVNDTWGHQRGDEVLVAMARFLSRHTRPQDAVVRLGGDEFVVLLRGADARFTASIAARIEDDRARAPNDFTLGEATFGHGVSLEQGLAEADQRLYQKRANRLPGASPAPDR